MEYSNLFEQALPVAPLKIAALDGCLDLGKKVNDYLIGFRKDTLKESLDSPLFCNYQSDNYLIDCKCPRFGSGEAKESSMNPSVEKTYLLWWMYATIA